ncbi:MAG: hypothetical protein QQN63_04985 [Nitrosopumilus sp.]
MKEELRIALALADSSELEYFLKTVKYCRAAFGDETTLKTIEKSCQDLIDGIDPWKARTPQTPAGIGSRIAYFTGPIRRLWTTSKK